MKKLDKFKLLKNTDTNKKDEIFDSFDGLVCGAILKEGGKDIKVYFTNKEYFELIVDENCNFNKTVNV